MFVGIAGARGQEQQNKVLRNTYNKGEIVNQPNTKFWWAYTTENLCSHLATNAQQGLPSTDAESRLARDGLNQLPEAQRYSVFNLFIHQFASPLVIILIAALIIAGFMGEWVDAIAIGVIVIANAIIGFMQEYSAEHSLAALRRLTKPMSRVIRNNILQVIPSNHLVVGDIVQLEAGDYVPADGRIIQSIQLTTQEATLTGESNTVRKHAEPLENKPFPLAEQTNMAFMGTVVTSGKGYMLITATALHTELGKIATVLQQQPEEPTPLQIQLKRFGTHLIGGCLGIVTFIFILGLIRGHALMPMFLSAVSLAVAAIPEGLPAVVTITLAIGMRRMAKKKTLIRRLASIETLGCATVICTDKTGTLTKNEMSVRHVWVNDMLINVTGAGYAPQGSFKHNDAIINPLSNAELMTTLRISMLCNNASLYATNGHWQIAGDPTEGALIVASAKAGLEKQRIDSEYQRTDEIPFDSERKRMSIACTTPQGRMLFVKGAPDIILQRSSSMLMHGKTLAMDDAHKKQILSTNDQLARQALRVLAVAYRPLDPHQQYEESLEQELVFVGMLAMMDPPRPEAQKAIALCKRAGIRVIMITGDHKQTASAVARELGMITNDGTALSGSELDQLTEDEFKKVVTTTVVYARTTAEHKMRIIHMLKALGEVVAMTGDGVNDAPAIKAADIGVAMGITGTEVTKEASDMVITDDNFATIVSAIEEGRGIYDNIVKCINYLLTSNIAELLIILLGTIIGFTDQHGNIFVVLLPIHLLWLNLITDGLPSLALGIDPLHPHAMARPPRAPQERILSPMLVQHMITIGMLIALGTLGVCWYGLRQSSMLAHTMALTTLVMLELVRIHMIRADYGIRFLSNPWLIASLASSFGLQMLIVYHAPFQAIFKTVALGWREWLVMIVAVLMVWIVGSWLQNTLNKKRRKKHA